MAFMSQYSLPTFWRHATLLSVMLTSLLSGCTSTGPRAAETAGQEEASRIQTAFPLDNIQSAESALQAKSFAEQERLQVMRTFSAHEQQCYDSFFTTRCLNIAVEKKRASLNAIQGIDVEAEAFLRREKVRKRDEALAVKQNKDQSVEETLKEQPVPAVEPAAAVKAGVPSNLNEEAMPRPRRLTPGNAERDLPAGPDPRVADHQQLRQQKEQQRASEAVSREESARKFEEKKREADTRQREISRTKAEKALQSDAMKNEVTTDKKK